MSTFVNNLYHRWVMRRDAIRYARLLGVSVGENCRLLEVRRTTFGSEPYLIRLGDHVTVSTGVRFVTHDGGVAVFRNKRPDLDVFGPIIVGNNVFIGANAILLKGIEVADDCVIGAGSIVTRNVPTGSVVAGCPARYIKSIDDYQKSIDAYRSQIPGCEVDFRSLSKAEKQHILKEIFQNQQREPVR